MVQGVPLHVADVRVDGPVGPLLPDPDRTGVGVAAELGVGVLPLDADKAQGHVVVARAKDAGVEQGTAHLERFTPERPTAARSPGPAGAGMVRPLAVDVEAVFVGKAETATWPDKSEEQHRAALNNRCRMKRSKGKAMPRRRSEVVERTFAHICETGGSRRSHLRGLVNVSKRLCHHLGTHRHLRHRRTRVHRQRRRHRRLCGRSTRLSPLLRLSTCGHGSAAARLRLSRTCGNLTRHGRSGRRGLIGGEARLRLEASGAGGHHGHRVLRVRCQFCAQRDMVSTPQRARRREARSDDAECPDAPLAPLGRSLKESSDLRSASDPCVSSHLSPRSIGLLHSCMISGHSGVGCSSDRVHAETLSPACPRSCVSASRTVARCRIPSRC